LLDTLRTNLKLHVDDYTEAVIGYQKAALAAIDNKRGELETDALTVLHFDLTPPRTYEKAYKQVIRMLEMETRDEIELNSSQFGCFVMDDWEWKEEFSVSNTRYKAFK